MYMRFFSIKSLLVFPLLLLPLQRGECQQLPTIKKNSSVIVGTLPDNVRYYLAPNSTTKGYANFLLVQKSHSDIEASRALLRDLPHFSRQRPYQFLASKGVGYGKDGYVSVMDGSTVYSFNGVPTFDAAATDSTLLLIFDLVESFPGEQAIVVSGDITKDGIESKLHVFSLTVPDRVQGGALPEYRWNPSEEPVFTHTQNNTANLAEITFTWNAPRTPEDRLLSPQPLVSSLYAGVLEHVLGARIRHAFFREGIALASFSGRYSGSDYSGGDERYSYSISIGRQDILRAMEVLGAIFSDLDSAGASRLEMENARVSTVTSMSKELSTPVPNSDLAGQCVSAFLYGTNIVDPETVRNFFKGRQLPVEQELSLFNSFVSALLDPKLALSVNCDTPAGPLDGEAVMESFYKGWYAPLADKEAFRVNGADTLMLRRPRGHRVKVKSTTTDPVTGGSIWTFSNGVRVVFKKTSQKGFINYGLLLKGGYTYVPGLSFGESAFVGDVMGLYNISGMPPMEFNDMLDANGISMQGVASLTDVRVLGSSRSDKLDLLLSALLSYSKDRTPDKRAFEYYKACEVLLQEKTRLSRDGIIAAIDSTMCPDYMYPGTKSLDRLRSDLPDRVDSYLDSQFSKFNDGLLVIIGDIDEDELQGTLGRYLGNFSVSDAFSVRPKVEYNLRNYWSTYNTEASHSNVGSGEVCVNVGMATCKPFTIKSYSAFLIASTAMKRAVTRALAEVGMYAETSVEIQVFPAERLSIFITCRECAQTGLPAGVSPATPLEVLGALRRGISGVSEGSISRSDLAGLKTTLLNTLSTQMGQSSFLMDAVMTRNSECKDIVSNYKDAVNSVTLEDVNSILHDLDFGSKVEYIIR